MLVSSSNNQSQFLQQRTSTKSDNPSQSEFDDIFKANSCSEPTQQQIQEGYFGCSRTTLAVLMTTGRPINTLAFLTPSDIDLIQRTTGVTIKDGGYYDSDGNQLGIHSDSRGNLLDPNPSQSKAAFDLAETLSEMRDSGGPQGDTSLQKGRKVTVDDLETYLKDYAAAKASGQNVYVPNEAVIKQAEQILMTGQAPTDSNIA